MILILLIVALQIADIATTVIALARGGRELNPLAEKLFGAFGVFPAAILLKLLGSIPMIAFAVMYPAYWMVPAAYAFLLVGLVAHNLFTLADQRDG